MSIRALMHSVLAVLLTGALGAAPAPDSRVPLDPEIRTGALPNGLRYFIRHNEKPENRAELRLVVNAGSILEEDDQQGLAHFLEHMAFNGTTHFAPSELVNFLESVGSEFGPDLNAYTSFDETVYMLEIPTDKEGLLDQGLVVLSDWAHGMTLDPAEIEKERGVVLEEWRLGRGAQERIQKVHWPVLLKGSRYASRLPIGQTEVIEKAPEARVRAYYTGWYRPDLMAVVAVGDFEVDAMEAMIRKSFSDIPRPSQAAERPVADVPILPETLAAGALDPEMPYTQVSLSFKQAPGERGTVRAFRRALAEGLAGDMLNVRLDEIRQKTDAPFLYAASGSGPFLRRLDLFQVFAVSPEGGAERALRALTLEIARVREHGFTAGELERAKARVLSAVEQQYREREKTESASHAGALVSYFLSGHSVPGVAWEYDRTRELLPEITLAEVTEAVSPLIAGESRVILAAAPQKGPALPDDATLVRVVKEALAESPAAYEDVVAGTQLLEQLPEPGKITARRHKPSLGVTILTFGNGVEAWLKPTDFKDDEILLGASVRGGLSRFKSEEYASASFATSLVEEAGLGKYTPSDLQKLLSGKIVAMSPTVDDFTQGFSGGSTPRDLESALQLLVLQVTAPNDRPEAFTVLQDRLRELVRNRLQSPEARFGDAVLEVNYQNHYMFRPLTPEIVNQVERDAAMAAYRRLFGDVSGYRFYVVGAFQPEEIEPLLARYLGTLPTAKGEPREFMDREVRFPAKRVERTVRAGTEPQGTVLITWPAATGLDEMKMFHLRQANQILEIRLRNIMREELGSTYSVSVGYGNHSPYPGYETTEISFGCAPEKTAALTERALAEVAKLKAEGITDEELAKVREIEVRGVEEGMQRNRYWLSSFLTLDLLRWDPERILARRPRAEAMTAKALHETFAENYPPDRYTVVTRLPEAGGE